jgi:hypothetical protein
VVGILAIAFSTGLLSGSNSGGPTNTTSSGSTSETNSFQAVNQTVIAIHVTAITSTTTTSASSVSTTTTFQSTTQSQTSGGSYAYNPSLYVKILSVAATVSSAQAGHQTLTFRVQFENVGSGTIYVLSGGGSSLSAIITSGASVVQEVAGPRCEIATVMGPVSAGGDWTATTPGCWSGFSYQLLEAGTIQVQLTLTWSGDNSQGSGSGSLVINAQFALN